MGPLSWYLLFALATALTAFYELFYPVMRKLAVDAPESEIIRNATVATAAMVVVAFVLAPLVFFPCIVPSMGERFRNSLFEELLKP